MKCKFIKLSFIFNFKQTKYETIFTDNPPPPLFTLRVKEDFNRVVLREEGRVCVGGAILVLSRKYLLIER